VCLVRQVAVFLPARSTSIHPSNLIEVFSCFASIDVETFPIPMLSNGMKVIGTIIVMLLQASHASLKSVSKWKRQRMCLYMTKRSRRNSNNDANGKRIVFIRHGCTDTE
jgi:hypothetical protein